MTDASLANRWASYGSSLVILKRVLYSRSRRDVQSSAGSTVARKAAGSRLIFFLHPCTFPESSSIFSLHARKKRVGAGQWSTLPRPGSNEGHPGTKDSSYAQSSSLLELRQ